MIELRSLSKATGCRVLAKAEFLNPGGSSKDRVALGIINEAEAAGLLQPGGHIVEGTAGSTGISLAMVARERGYRCTIVMPDDMAIEKSRLLEQLGAEVHRVPSVSIVNSEHYCKVSGARRLLCILPAETKVLL
jgi:cysteine synthase A